MVILCQVFLRVSEELLCGLEIGNPDVDGTLWRVGTSRGSRSLAPTNPAPAVGQE